MNSIAKMAASNVQRVIRARPPDAMLGGRGSVEYGRAPTDGYADALLVLDEEDAGRPGAPEEAKEGVPT